jgi:hypothetical protein
MRVWVDVDVHDIRAEGTFVAAVRALSASIKNVSTFAVARRVSHRHKGKGARLAHAALLSRTSRARMLFLHTCVAERIGRPFAMHLTQERS